MVKLHVYIYMLYGKDWGYTGSVSEMEWTWQWELLLTWHNGMELWFILRTF